MFSLPLHPSLRVSTRDGPPHPPAPVSELVTGLASAVGAPPPRHLPGWLARLAAGPQGYSLMTEVRGASNEKAKRELGWQPAHTWRDVGA